MQIERQPLAWIRRRAAHERVERIGIAARAIDDSPQDVLGRQKLPNALGVETAQVDDRGPRVPHEPLIGIIYLRPGHIRAAFVLEILDAIRDRAPEVEPPFLLVAARRGDVIRIRTRTPGTAGGPPPSPRR